MSYVAFAATTISELMPKLVTIAWYRVVQRCGSRCPAS